MLINPLDPVQSLVYTILRFAFVNRMWGFEAQLDVTGWDVSG